MRAPLGVIRQVLAAFFPPACVGLFDPLADFRVELAALSKFETKCGTSSDKSGAAHSAASYVV